MPWIMKIPLQDDFSFACQESVVFSGITQFFLMLISMLAGASIKQVTKFGCQDAKCTYSRS